MENMKVAARWKKRIEAFLVTMVIQGFFLALFFFGFLLDPLIGVWAASTYFLLVGTLSIYFCQINRRERRTK
jgi:hypothetical protein